MSNLDASLIRNSLAAETSGSLDDIELFSSIASTNTYLLRQSSPSPGRCRVAIAAHQTAGRGRHLRSWISPPGAGLCLSFAYTFAKTPSHLPSMTLAIGVGIIQVLHKLGVAGLSLKWPNDIVACDGKLGGILTEVQARGDTGVTVVTGIGLNIELPAGAEYDIESDWARQPVDIRSIVTAVPAPDVIAAGVIDGLYGVMQKFAALGLAGFAAEWAEHDWLRGRDVTVDLPERQITGIAAGVDVDGALLIDTGQEKTRVVSGSIVMAGPRQPE